MKQRMQRSGPSAPALARIASQPGAQRSGSSAPALARISGQARGRLAPPRGAVRPGPAASLLGLSLLALAGCGEPDGWVRIVVDVAEVAVPLRAGEDLDAVVLTLAPDGCAAREERFPQDGSPLTELPQDVVIVLGEDCPSRELSVTAAGFKGQLQVAASEAASATVGPDGAELQVVLSRLCEDGDGDGHGVGPGCLGPDCDESSATVHPGAAERCNGLDDDCDGVGDLPDGDGDGFRACDGDCNDQDPGVAPGHEERCDAVDEDCDGSLTAGCVFVGNGGFEAGLAGWEAVRIDTEGVVEPGLGIFDEPALVAAEPGATGLNAVRVAILEPGDYDGLMFCSQPFRLEAGLAYAGGARVKALYAGAPTRAVWAVARLTAADFSSLSVGSPEKELPHDGWGEVLVAHTPAAAVDARLCLLYRSIRDASQGGPTDAGTALIWDDAALLAQ